MSYLLRRGASYYARLKVPTDLVAILGKKELVKALGTKDQREAKRLMWPVVGEWNRQFDDLRARRQLTGDDKADAVWQHYSDTLERDEETRRSMPTTSEIEAATATAVERAKRDAIDVRDPFAVHEATLDVMLLNGRRKHDAHSRRVKLDLMRKHLIAGETALIADEVEEYLDRNKLLIEPGSSDHAELARQMMRAEIDALQRTLERDRGDYSGTPTDPIIKPVTGTTREFAAPGERIMDLFETYVRENPRGISADTLNQARRDISFFVQHVGNNYPAHRIDKKAVRGWKSLMISFPVKATESKVFAGMSLQQIVKHNEKVGKPVLSPRTVNRYLASLGAFCTWLETQGYLDHSPMSGMSLAKEKKKSGVTFTTDQLNTLFKSPLFTGCQSANEWSKIAKPGNEKIRDHRYWVPLIMLYSGARPAEIAQLSIGDVKEQHGHWIMHITTEGDGEKTVKTAGSMRVVPIHKELIKLGLLDYHSGMKAAGQPRLFPHAHRNSRGQMIADFSREFGRYLVRLGLKKGRGLSLYSFRHTATDALRRASHLDQQFAFILGHTGGTMTGRYGNLPEGMLAQRVALIDSIAYPDLSLTHLK